VLEVDRRRGAAVLAGAWIVSARGKHRSYSPSASGSLNDSRGRPKRRAQIEAQRLPPPAAMTGVAILRLEAPICSGLRALYKFG